MPRTIQPELLDSLPPQHPDALHNRRDLRLTNCLMGNHRWLTETLPSRVRPGESILELGAGLGELSLRLRALGLAVDALDLWPQPEDWSSARRWHQSDLRTFSHYHEYPVVIGNLIFHQFRDDELATIGTMIKSTARVIIACEPTRRRLSQVSYRVLGPLFGANHISMHDAHVSIDAGFIGLELPRGLGLDPKTWNIRCSTTARGAYHLIAVRHG
jgi:hypothetical protein